MDSIEKQVSELVEKAESASTSEEARVMYRKAIALIDSASEDQQASLAYARGYAWYNLPEEAPERAANVEKFLRQAVALTPGNCYANLYLGHYYFDIKDYQLALKELSNIPNRYFSDRSQAWRDLKRIELILCCFLYLNKPADAFRMLEDLIAEAANVPERDRPVMSELKCALSVILTKSR